MSRAGVAIFFRKRTPPFEPAVRWVFAEDIDASYQELKSLGANIVDPLEKPWGLRQFTVRDLDETRSISIMTSQPPHNERLELASSPAQDTILFIEPAGPLPPSSHGNST